MPVLAKKPSRAFKNYLWILPTLGESYMEGTQIQNGPRPVAGRLVWALGFASTKKLSKILSQSDGPVDPRG